MKTVIIDVRSEKEFNEGTYPGAINIPSVNLDIKLFSQFNKDHIALVCNSGNRAKKVKHLLELAGHYHVSLLKNQMVHLEEGPKEHQQIWSVDRQFRMAIGILIGLYVWGNYMLNSPYALAILLTVFSGLIYSATTDNCYLKALIAVFPWNRNVKEFSVVKQP